MADEERKPVDAESAGKRSSDRILNEQQLVNERQEQPQEFGGQPQRPPEDRETPVEEIEPQPGKRDIQTQGS